MLQMWPAKSLFSLLPHKSECSTPCQREPQCSCQATPKGLYRQATTSTNLGRVNQISAEETDGTSDVILGTLPVNYVPTSVLFDLGASHSFMSESYALRHELSFVEMSTPMIIQTPRSRWLSRPGVCVCNSCYNSII